MPNILHKNLIDDDIHTDIARVYADITARNTDTAFNLVSTNINKNVRVDSPVSVFKLVSVTGVPATDWLELSSTLTDSFLELNDTPASYSGEALKVVSVNAGETGLEFTTNLSGNVFGPASSTDNALARFDLATGKLIQNSLGILNDAGVLSGLTQVVVDNLSLDGNTLSSLSGGLILTSPAATINVSSSLINNVSDPISNQDAATKKYVDDQIVLFDTFLELTDTPSNYGGGNQLINVNAIGTALEFNVATLNFAGEMADLTKLTVDSLTLDGSSLSSNSGNLLFDSFTGIIDADTNKIINVVDPTANQDAATKKYVDDENTGQVIGPSSAVDTAIVTFDGTTGKLIQEANLTLIGQTIRPASGNPLDFILKSNLFSASSLLCFEDDLTRRMEVGNKSTTVFETTLVTSQIIMNNASTALHIATRGNFASDMIFYTAPSAAGLLERMRILGNGNVGIGETAPESPLHVKFGSAGVTAAPVGTTLTIESNQNNFITMFQPNAMSAGLIFGDPAVNVAGAYLYTAGDEHTWSVVNNSIKMTLDSAGHLGVGVGAGSIQGIVNIVRGSSGATANPLCQEVVLEHPFDAGMSILTANNGRGRICFGDVANNAAGFFIYDHNSDVFSMISTGDVLLNPGSGIIDASTSKITQVVDPTADQDAATKKYVDDNAGTGDVVGPGSATDNAIARFDLTTGKLIQNSTTTIADDGQVFIDSTNNIPLIVRMDAVGGNPSYMEFRDSLARLRVGYLSTDFSTAALQQAQIGADLNGGIQIASRGNIASGITLSTPNAAFDGLVERFLIQTNGFARVFSDIAPAFRVESTGNITDVVLELRNTFGDSNKIIRFSTSDVQVMAEINGFSRPVGSDPMLEFNVTDGTVLRPRFHIGGKFGIDLFDRTGAIITQWNGEDGRISMRRGQASKTTTIADADYTVLSTDYRFALTSITAPRTITIPTLVLNKASPTEVWEWVFKDESGNLSGVNTITFVGGGGELFDGAASLVVKTPFADFKLYSNGTNIFVEGA